MKIREAYKVAKDNKIGELTVCPSCGELFVKVTKAQAFCKNKGGTICKDKYWNTVTPTKRNNTTRISPANRFYKKNVIDPMREYREMNEDYDYDPGDSEYWDNSDNFVSV
jgi:hypothetical protein